jgi:sarcosine oxidase subunit gamma
MADHARPTLVTNRHVTVSEHEVALCVLRVRDPSRAAALGGAFAQPWPSEPGAICGEQPVAAWLGPGEWALFAAAESVRPKVETACAGVAHLLVDLSAARRRWRIQGSEAAQVIAKGCSLDTDPRVFGRGRCAQTLLAQTHVLLVPQLAPSGQPSFDIIGDVSLAGHLRGWLADATREFQP